MIKKKIDCVEMKHKGAESIAEKISGLSQTDELDFWKRSNQELIKMKNAIESKTRKRDQL